jgi:putative transposase
VDVEAIKKRRRLSAQAWREVLGRFDGAGTSVAAFCKREGVCESSFHRWRSRLVATPAGGAVVERAPQSTSATFVELGALGDVVPSAAPRIDLKLDLGGGLTLHLVRG